MEHIQATFLKEETPTSQNNKTMNTESTPHRFQNTLKNISFHNHPANKSIPLHPFTPSSKLTEDDSIGVKFIETYSTIPLPGDSSPSRCGTTTNLDFYNEDTEPKFNLNIRQCASAMLNSKGGVSNKNEPFSSCSIPQVLNFDSDDDSDISIETKPASKNISEKITDEQGGQTHEEIKSASSTSFNPFSSMNSGFMTSKSTHNNNLNPTFFSQFTARTCKVQRSVTDIYQLPAKNNIARAQSIGMNVEEYVKEIEVESRFQQDYDIIKSLGNGGFSKVYSCKNKLDGQVYVVKCMNKKLKNIEDMRQILNDMHVLTSTNGEEVNHNIVRYYNAWVEEDKLYIVMESCDHNLNELKQSSGIVDEQTIRVIMRDICSALSHIEKYSEPNQNKIAHLHIKPENILFSQTNKWKLADLGISKLVHENKFENVKTIGGSHNKDRCYFAPELLNNGNRTPSLDLSKSDIFSLGITLYELMMGINLRSDENARPDLTPESFANFDMSTHYSQSLKDVIKSMLNEDPNKRPSADEILKASLPNEKEKEVKMERNQNKILKKEIQELGRKLGIKKKKSI